MVNAPKKNLSPFPAGKYSKWTKQFTQQSRQANQGKSGWTQSVSEQCENCAAYDVKRSFGGEKMGNTLFKQQRETDMDWELCG